MRTTKLERARFWLHQELQWFSDHGASRSAYIARYGSALDDEHYGDGGEAIYFADLARLNKLEADVASLEHRAPRHFG